jgi:hypothetical protein
VAFALALVHGFASGTDSGAVAMRVMYLVTGQIAIVLTSLRIWRAKPQAKDTPRPHAAEQPG